MNDDEFLEMCRLAAGPDTGGQCTDKKIDAVEQVEADPRGTVRRLYGLYMAEWQRHEITAAGMRQMRDYKDRSFVQMGDHAGRLEIERDQLRAALDAATQRAEAAEAVAGNMLNHLLPDTIRAIVLDLSAAERHAPDMGEFAITPQTLEFRDKCAAFLGAEWPDSAWDEEWLTALDAERARRARSEQDEVQP